ncbi:hypothetical protein [Nocardia gipuzkoensis]|uniref:hypothetical protein n=1 Tax=Nocardia gipuzkoensis TaxID=2749991 RepID=UPI0015EEBBEC|nr:hypothetical protein [Nocardia gipuzkoensis]
MTATLNTPDTAVAVSPFAEALGEIEYLLEVDPDRARERFAEVLTLASPQERQLLDRAADLLTRSPFKVAARQLGWMAKSRPEMRDMIIAHTADSDPGLYRPELPQQSDTSIEAAEWVRRSIRDRRNRDQLTATPTAATDAARLSAEAIVTRRAARTPVWATVSLRHRERDRRVTERREGIYAAYAADRLYAIDTEPDTDRTPPVPEPRKPVDLMWAHVQADLWDRSYFLHVAHCYTEADRHLLAPEASPRRGERDGRDSALDEAARAFLRDHDTDPGHAGGGDRRTRSRRVRRGLPPRITPVDQSRFAARRTGLPVPDDRDEYLPYTELDVRESTWQGSGLDYDLAAMTPYLGWPCVGCWIDRPASDRRAVHALGGDHVSDDGLCDVCRADGHPGIAPLAPGWGMRSFVESRCTYIAATHPRQARAILDRIRAAAANTGPTWRLITRWMAVNLDQPTPVAPAPRPAARRLSRAAALGAGQRVGRCDACARPSVVHADGYCTTCRIDLGLVAARRRSTAA